MFLYARKGILGVFWRFQSPQMVSPRQHMPCEKQIGKRRSETMGRIASMRRAELANRMRQELHKRTDAILFGLGIDPSRGELRRKAAESPKFFFCGKDVPQ